MKDFVKETDRLMSKIMQLDQEIYETNLPFRITVEAWENPRHHPLNKITQTDEIKEFMSVKIGLYPDPRVFIPKIKK